MRPRHRYAGSTRLDYGEREEEGEGEEEKEAEEAATKIFWEIISPSFCTLGSGLEGDDVL